MVNWKIGGHWAVLMVNHPEEGRRGGGIPENLTIGKIPDYGEDKRWGAERNGKPDRRGVKPEKVRAQPTALQSCVHYCDRRWYSFLKS
jgi:hypothetical protein